MSKEMRDIQLDKAVVKAEKVLGMVTGKKPVRTMSKTTNRDFGIRQGMQIGCKVTIRGKEAEEFVKKALWIRENRIATWSFDPEGNFSFGIPDYTDFPGMKYDPEIGIFGLDVSVSLVRPGRRIARRRIMRRRVPKHHRVSKKEGQEYVRTKFGVEVVD
jgi:large subunit ribosomal protein L5